MLFRTPSNERFVAPIWISVGTIMVALILLPGVIQAQDTRDCANALSEAETAYFSGNFDLTISLLTPCLDSDNYTPAQGIRAYTLFGRTQFILGETEAATSAIEGLYALDPAYEPGPELPPNFSTFILETKQKMIAENRFPEQEEEQVIEEPAPEQPEVTIAVPEKKSADEASQRKRKVLLFGGGAVLAVAGAAAILLSGGSGGDDPVTPSEWPLPPAHP